MECVNAIKRKIQLEVYLQQTRNKIKHIIHLIPLKRFIVRQIVHKTTNCIQKKKKLWKKSDKMGSSQKPLNFIRNK